jgi:hypothetical protein
MSYKHEQPQYQQQQYPEYDEKPAYTEMDAQHKPKPQGPIELP